MSSSTRSANLAASIIDGKSFGHSTNVMRLFLPATSVMGPLMCGTVWRVKCFTKQRMSNDLPT